MTDASGEPTSQAVPSGVWTRVGGADLSAYVYQDNGRDVVVTVSEGVVTLPEQPTVDDDPRIAQFEQERADAIEIAHRAMATSYIGAPPANLRGDADRMVAALLKAGWTPPSGTIFEYAEMMFSGAMLVYSPIEDQDGVGDQRRCRGI